MGQAHRVISQHTHPTIKAYADKIGADFIIINKQLISQTTPHYEKFQIYHLLNKYHRIIYVDTDIIIRSDCPDLFKIVPEDHLAAFNEAPYADRTNAMKGIAEEYGVKLDKWDGQYYNSGVMVISRRHKDLFQKPTAEIMNFFEQSYLNLQFYTNRIKIYGKLKIHDLNHQFNRMTCLDPFIGESRLASYIVHYAGAPELQMMLGIMIKDIEQWQKDHPKYEYKKNIAISVHGGLGDEVCAEPAIRYIVEKAYKDSNVHIITWFPRLFLHLAAPVYQMGEFKGEQDTTYFKMDTLAPHGHPAWRHMSPNLIHTVDYTSIMCLKKVIPDEHKQIKLQVEPEDEQEVQKIVGEVNWSNTVLIHPGKGWPTKTFPEPYWNEIIEKLSHQHQVILIGKDISDEQGSIKISIPKNVKDARNLLGLGGLITIISKAHTLLSNDSAPIHLAGAFDNWIILIPTCKHPDHVLPYRNNGNRHYKTMAIYKKLTCEMVDDRPTQLVTQTIDQIPGGDLMVYLPEIDDVITAVHKSFGLAISCDQIAQAVV